MSKGDRRPACLLLLLIATLVLHGYTISPDADIHEDMTRAAKHCLDVANGAAPEGCEPRFLEDGEAKVDVSWLHDSSIRFYDVIGWIRRWTGLDARYPNLREAVRWPDDPTRQISVLGGAKFGVNMLSGCASTSADGTDINDGLLCNSHYGDMQFLHAQASSLGEPAAVTHGKILRWADFLFNVASGHLNNQTLDEPYCAYFGGEDAFSKAMLPDQQALPCDGGPDERWTLTTLFTFKCSNPLQSQTCTEETGPSRHDKARISAAGALLHLIQDSYSQSHCARGQCGPGHDGKVLAKVECLPITMFTTYKGQQHHKDADRRPRFAPSCRSGNGVDDPISASAKALWHIRNRSTIEAFRADLYRVFGTPESIRGARAAGLGECFGDRQPS